MPAAVLSVAAGVREVPWRGPCRVERPCGPGSDRDGRHVDTLGAGSEDEGLSSLCRVSHATWPNAGHFL